MMVTRRISTLKRPKHALRSAGKATIASKAPPSSLPTVILDAWSRSSAIPPSASLSSVRKFQICLASIFYANNSHASTSLASVSTSACLAPAEFIKCFALRRQWIWRTCWREGLPLRGQAGYDCGPDRCNMNCREAEDLLEAYGTSAEAFGLAVDALVKVIG